MLSLVMVWFSLVKEMAVVAGRGIDALGVDQEGEGIFHIRVPSNELKKMN